MTDDGTVNKVIMKNIKTPSQVPTGDVPIIMIAILAIVSVGFAIYYHYNQKNKIIN